MSLPDNHNVIAFAAPHDGGDDPGFEAMLRRALEIPLPDQLPERILLRQTTSVRQSPRWRIAAGVALAVAAGGVFFSATRSAHALPELATEHTLYHPGPGSTATLSRVAPSQVRAIFARRGVVLKQVPAEVNYISLCELGSDLSLHMISRMPAGAVTVYFVPGRSEKMRLDFSDSGMVGRSVPLAQGALVMLGTGSTDFDAIEAHWRAAF